MSLSRMRRWSRVVAVMLLIAAARATPHFAQDDVACSFGFLGSFDSDTQSPQLDSRGFAPLHEHCAICHWTRSLRSPLTPLDLRLAELAPSNPVYRPTVIAVLVPARENLPARAPPSGLL